MTEKTDSSTQVHAVKAPAWAVWFVALEWLVFVPLCIVLFLAVVFSLNKYDLEWLYFPGWVEFFAVLGLVFFIRKLVYWSVPSLVLADQESDIRVQLKEFKEDLRSVLKSKKGGFSASHLEQASVFYKRAVEEIKKGSKNSMDAFKKEVEKWIEKVLPNYKNQRGKRFFVSIVLALLFALSLRTFGFEVYKVPTGSMIPTIQVGDQILVNKFIYGVKLPFLNVKIGSGFRSPKRGEIIVFVCPPNNPSCVNDPKDYIKRVVAVAGDTVDIRDGNLYINRKEVFIQLVKAPCVYEDVYDGEQYTFKDAPYAAWYKSPCHLKKETLDGVTYNTIYEKKDSGEDDESSPSVKLDHPHVSFPRVIPEGKVFVMGDNRDHSNDSRFWGEVPIYPYIKGRAERIVWSIGPLGKNRVRLERLGKRMDE